MKTYHIGTIEITGVNDISIGSEHFITIRFFCVFGIECIHTFGLCYKEHLDLSLITLICI